MFDSTTWTQCLSEFWYGDALPNMSEQLQKPRLTFEELFEALPDREELEYQLDTDNIPYRALPKSRFDTPEHIIIFGDTLRRLLLFRGTRMALKRKGFQKDVKLIANSTSEQCIAALKSSAGQPGEVRNANMEALSNNEKIALELRTALRQVLISTKDVPLTDGYKRNLRHESHNLNIAEGALAVFATFNFADNYAPLLFQLVRGGSDGSAEHIGEDIVCSLTDDAPNMPSLQQMHQLIAQSPRAQAKFFLLMDDIADIYFMGMDSSFIGRHHVQKTFHHRHIEDQLASTAIPSLGGYGVAELEPFESQERGFQHGHRKKYAIPKSQEAEIIEQFKKPDQSGLYKRLEECKPARLISGRTMHSGQGPTPKNSMRTTSLALNAQAKHKLSITHADADVLHIDESSMLQGELNHAASLRTTYARESKHKLDRNNYSSPSERYGQIAILWYSQDHLQLPPVPESSSTLALFAGTSDEHKVGAKIFRNAELVFQFNTAMRFTDKTLIQILEAMRTPGGRKLSPAQWQALVDTECSAEQSADVSAARPDQADWKTVALRHH